MNKRIVILIGAVFIAILAALSIYVYALPSLLKVHPESQVDSYAAELRAVGYNVFVDAPYYGDWIVYTSRYSDREYLNLQNWQNFTQWLPHERYGENASHHYVFADSHSGVFWFDGYTDDVIYVYV